MTFNVFLLFAFVAGSLAGPISLSQDPPPYVSHCIQTCPITDLPKQGFKPDTTYKYVYEGTALTWMEDVQMNSSSSLQTKFDVELSFFSVCQAVVSISNPVINGISGDSITTELLTSHPMIVTLSETVATSVCVHPEDHPDGLNLKKGIISTIQNSLPSFDTTNSTITIVESDILGNCPTQYETLSSNNLTLVNKFKDHLQCFKNLTSSDAPITPWWLKSFPTYPINSNSTCKQVWTDDHILKSVDCVDENVLRLIAGSSKIVKSTHWSVLTLQNVQNGTVKPIFDTGRSTSLSFEKIPQPKTQEVVPEVEELLKELCGNITPELSIESARITAKIISLLQRAPEDAIETILTNIINGKYCRQSNQLESIYLDAIMYIDNGGAIAVMVNEVLSGKVSGAREPMYAIAIHLAKRPCIHGVKSVSRLFDTMKASPSIILAAGTLVNKYCKFHPNCMSEPAVEEIMNKLMKRLDSSCSSSLTSEQKKMDALTVLKTIGNMANISQPLEKSIMRCVEASGADIMVRVAAAQAFRQVPCQQQPIASLLKLAINTQIPTEVRIASYVAAIPCSYPEDASMLLKNLAREPNTQVRSFVFSHMRNIQRSDAPYLRDLRYNLSSLVIPTDYDKDLRLYSRNVDMSYYLPTVGVGAGIDTSIIYTPGSYIPRQYQANFTANIFDNVVNIGEFAVRMEDIEALFEMLFGPKGFFHNKTHLQIAEEISKMLSKNGQKIKEHLKKLKTFEDGDAKDPISHIFNMFKPRDGQTQKPRLDTLIRLFGQEISFTSLVGDIRHIDADDLIAKLAELGTKMIVKLMDFDFGTVRLIQSDSENLIVTQQGIPLQLKMVCTGLMGFMAKGGISLGNSSVQMNPSIITALNGFAGVTLGAKSGIRLRSKAQLSAPVIAKLEKLDAKMVLSIDMPKADKLTLVAEGNTYTVFKMPSKEDTIISPINGSYPVTTNKDCLKTTEIDLGLVVCWDAMWPKYSMKNIAPFGYMRANITLDSLEKSKNFFEISGTMEKQPSLGSLILQLDFPGAVKPTKGQLEIKYSNGKDLKALQVYLEASKLKRSLRFEIEPKSSKSGRKYEMAVYSGKQREISSTDKVMITAVGGKSTIKELSGEFELKTLNSLEDYLKAQMEFDASILLNEQKKSVPKGIDLRKFEVDIAVPRWFRTVHYIRKKSTGLNNLQYLIRSMMKTPARELYNISGVAKVEGSLEKSNLNTSVVLDVNAEKLSYKSEAGLISNRREMSVFAMLKNRDETKNIFYVDLSGKKAKSSSTEWTTKAILEFPRFMVRHSLDGSLRQKGPNEYDVKLAAKKENDPIYEIEGPVTWIQKENRVKEQCNLIIKDLKHAEQLSVVSKMILSPEKSNVNLDVKKSGKPVFSFDGDFTAAKNLARLTAGVGVQIPEVIEAKLKVEKRTDRTMQMMLNGFWKPNTEESQKIKGVSSVDLNKREIKFQMSYDADRDQNRAVAANLQYNINSKLKVATAKGDLSLGSKKYLYDSELVLGSLSVSPKDNNIFKLKIVRPGGAVFLVESDCLVKREGPSMKSLEYKGIFQHSSNKVYKVVSKMTYDTEEAPLRMVLKGRTEVATPQMKELVITINTDVDLISKEQKMKYQMELSGSSLKKPTKALIDISNDRSAKKTNVNVDIDAAALKFESKGHARNNMRNEVEDLDLEISLHMSNETRLQLKTEKYSNKHFEISLLKDGEKVLAWEHNKEDEGQWSCRLTVPSRVMEGHSKISSQDVSVSWYPHKDRNDEKYEVSGHFKGQQGLLGGSSIDAGAKILYPGSNKPIAIRTSVALDRSSSEGTLELDIFKDPKDKVFVHLKSSKPEKDSYKVAATFEIPTRNANPRVIVEAGLSPKIKLFRFFMEDGSSNETLVQCSASYNVPADNHAYIRALLVTPSDLVEMTAAIQGHSIFQCRGASVNGTININNKTLYDFASSFCAPGYIEVGVKESWENKMYLIKAGMKNPTSIKLALDLVHNSTKAFQISSVKKLENTLNLYGKHIYLPKEPVILLGAKLWAPMMVTLDAKYEVKEANEYLDKVLKPIIENLKYLSKKVCEVIPEKVFQSFAPWTSFTLVDELRDVKDEIVRTYHTLSKELGFWPFPSVDDIKQEVSRLFDSGVKAFRKVTDKVEEILDTYFGTSLKEIQMALRKVDTLFKEGLKCVHEKMEEIVNAMKEGRDAMMKIEWVKWIIERVEGNSIWDWIMEKWNELKEKFEYEISAIENFFSGIFSKFMDELKAIMDKLASFGFFTKFIKWIESWLFDHNDDLDTTLVASVAKKFYSFYVDEKEAFISVQIPLRQPVSSLAAALPSIGIPQVYKYFWRKPSTIIMSLASPHSAVAKLTNDNIVTFNGLVIPFLDSKCQLRLTSACGVKFFAKKMSNQKMELILTSDKGGNVKMHFQEGVTPSVEGLKASDKEMNKPGLDVKRSSPSELQVESECFKITLNKREVEVVAKPWAYNKVEGLLGTHDHEIATDVPRSAEVHYKPESNEGSHHLSASSAKRVLDSFRKDIKCKIPSP